MRKFYWVYGGIATVLIVLKIFGLVGWWVATSFIWFPIGVVLSISFLMALTADMGKWLKKRKESKIIPSCENCLFNHTKEVLKDEECLGEQNHAEKKDGKCPYWTKYEGR